MRRIIQLSTLCLCVLLFGLLVGCSSSSSSSTSSKSSYTDTAKDAWGAASFAMNIANPIYYAKQGAKYGYKQYEANKK